jgi:hypothetical protein
MGSILPLVGIAALLVFGFVVLMTALTYDPPLGPDARSDRAPTRSRRPRRQRIEGRGKQVMSTGRSAVRKFAVTLRALFDEWGPRARHYARYGRARWLTLDSTSGQLIAGTAASLVVAWLVVTLTG